MNKTTLSANQNRFWSWLCIGAIFANFLLDSMLAPALPAIGESLGISESQLGFIFTCGLLSAAISLPLGGRIADIWDKRLVLIGILIISTCGAATASFATTFAMAAIGQVLLGMSIVLIPLGVAIAAKTENNEKTTSFIFVSSGVSALAGLAVGGYILEHFNYRALYWIVGALNFGLLVIALLGGTAWRGIDFRRRAADKLDLRGGVLLGAGLALFLYGVSMIGQDGFAHAGVVIPLTASLAFFALWWLGAQRTSSPMLDPRMLQDPIIARFSAIQIAVGFNGAAVLVAVSMIVTAAVADGGLGQSEAMASYIFIPSSILMFIAPLAVVPMRARIGARWVLLWGGTLIAVGTALLIATYTLPAIVVGTVLGSIGLSLVLTQTFDLIALWIQPERVASVSGFILVVKIVGSALGAQLTAVAMELLPAGRGFMVAILVSTLVTCIAIPVAMGLGRKEKAS